MLSTQDGDRPNGSDGRLLACTARRLAALGGAGRTIDVLEQVAGEQLGCLTAVAAGSDGAIFISDGGSRHCAEDWRVDLMEGAKLGRIVARLRTDVRQCPGAAARAELPRRIGGSRRPPLVRRKLRSSYEPCAAYRARRNWRARGHDRSYPSRLGAARAGGFWLSLFALRTHLVEFVLCEDDFRNEMMRTIPQAYWVAPALNSGRDCLEPLQVGGLRALGIEKPWAPPRSCGLAARLDADGEVVETLHSRVGGRHHGVTAAIETAQGGVLISKDSGRILLHRPDPRQ